MANTFKSPLQKAVITWLAAHPDVTVAELSRRSEIDKSDLGKINAGTKASLNMESAGRLAKAMGTTVECLLDGEATAPNAVRSDVHVGVRLIPLADIDPSPDNPRKEFEEEPLAQLAASIAEQGLLQPIVVRPKGERFEIVAGERRYRALKLNEATEALCLVREGDDEATTRALRIIENLQRADIKPIEEADAFLALAEMDPKKWNATTIGKAIGKAIGMSDRFVAQRISIARNLAPDLKEKLRAGELKIEIARSLAAWPQKLQEQIVVHDWSTAAHVRHHLESIVVPVSRAAFDRKHYKGEIVEHDGEEHFADRDLFLRLQDEAAAVLASSLAKDWPGARFAPKNARTGAYVWADNGDPIYRWTEDREPTTWHPGLAREDVTAVVYVDDSSHAVGALKGVVQRETFAAKAQKSDEQRAREAESEQEDQLHREVTSAARDFREQLLDEMPSHPKLAQMLFLYGAIGELGHGLYVETNPSEYLGPWKDQLAGILDMNEHGWEPYDAPADGEDKLLKWLIKLGPEQVDQMFCRLMAIHISIGRYTAPEAPHRFAYKALGLETPEVLQRAHAARSDDDGDDDLEDDVDEPAVSDRAEAA